MNSICITFYKKNYILDKKSKFCQDKFNDRLILSNSVQLN